MSIGFDSKVQSINTIRQLDKTDGGLHKAMARIASGHKINSAADNAAGLAIMEKMNAEVRALDSAQRNVSYGESAAQVADGALAGQGDQLARLQELAVQAGNGTLSDDDRAALQQEADQLVAQIDATASGTEFNGQSLLDGSFNTTVQVGSSAGDTVAVSASSSSASDLTVDAVDLTSQAGAQAALANIESAISSVASNRADLGAAMNRMSTVKSELGSRVENLTASKSRIGDADIAREVSNFAKHEIMKRSGTAMLAHGNAGSSTALRLLT